MIEYESNLERESQNGSEIRNQLEQLSNHSIKTQLSASKVSDQIIHIQHELNTFQYEVKQIEEEAQVIKNGLKGGWELKK